MPAHYLITFHGYSYYFYLMYQLLYYLKHLLRARHRKGRGIHSPFVYDFYTSVIKPRPPADSPIENLRKRVEASGEMLDVTDLGAGPRKGLSSRRPLRKIMKQTAIRKKYGNLLARLVGFIEPSLIIELGTGLGISTMYMAEAAGNARIISLEGSKEIAGKARGYFQAAGNRQIEVMTGRFSELVPGLLTRIRHPLLVFIDGDHDESRVLDIISRFMPVVKEDSVIVLHDIHLSRGMNNAWRDIVTMPRVVVSIELFGMGILFFRAGMYKQQYIMRLS